MAGRKPFSCMVLLAMTFLLTSCTSTKLIDTWKDDQFKGPAFKKIMVVSLMKNSETRQLVEDEFAGQLHARGVSSVTCYSCIPDAENLSREEIVKAVGKTGVEGVLVLEPRMGETRVESVRTESPTIGDSIGFDSYLLTATSLSGDTPMIRRDKVITMSTRLFDARTGKLVWFTTAETVDPGKAEREIAPFTKIILNALQKEKLI